MCMGYKQLNVTIHITIQSPSLKVNSCSATQEIPYLLWDSEVHESAHKSPLLVPVLSQMKTVHYLIPILLRFTSILYSHLNLSPSSSLFQV